MRRICAQMVTFGCLFLGAWSHAELIELGIEKTIPYNVQINLSEHGSNGFVDLEVQKDVLRVKLFTYINFPSEENARSTYGTRVGNCSKSFHSLVLCSIAVEEGSTRVKTDDVGFPRKVLTKNNQFILITSLGKALVYRVDGAFNKPRVFRKILDLPAQVSRQLVSEDVVNIMLFRGLKPVVIMLNGTLGGKPFGSTIYSLDCSDYGDGQILGKYTSSRAISKNYDVGIDYRGRLHVSYLPIPYLPLPGQSGRHQAFELPELKAE